MLHLLFILAPLLGLAANVPAQLIAGRFDPRHRVLRSALVGLAVGGVACLLVTLLTIPAEWRSPNYWVGLAVNGVSYVGFGFCYWVFLNLGAGSIRMRIFDEISARREGLTEAELNDRYDDRKLMLLRLQRMESSELISVKDGRYFVARRWLVALATIIRLAKMLVMGKPSQFAKCARPAPRPSEERRPSIGRRSFRWRLISGAQTARTWIISRLGVTVVLLVHLVALGVCSRIAFTNHRERLLHTMDGATELCLIRLQNEWMPFAPAFSNNPFSGIGNIFAFVNTRMMPCFALGSLPFGGAPDTTLIYTVCAFELFAAILFLGGCLRLSLAWNLFTAWAATLYTLPFMWPQKYLNMSDQDPHHIEMQAFALAAIGAFFLVGRGGVVRTIAAGLGTYAFVLLMAVTQPQWFIVSVPILGVFFLVFLLLSNSRSEMLQKGAAIVLMAVASLPTLLPYIAGSVLNSVPVFFGAEMRQVRDNILLTSILFHDDGWRYGQYLWIASFAGALIELFARKSPARPFAVATVCGQIVLLLAVWFTRYVLKDYHGPPILYMEIYLWPFYFFFGCKLVLRLVEFPARRALRAASVLLSHLGREAVRLKGAAPAWTFVLLILPASLAERSYESGKKPFERWPRPTQRTQLVEYLHQRVGMDSGDGSPFRGAVATFVGYDETREANWHTLFHTDYVNVAQGSGNQHRGLGLWEHNIPTLFDYNYLVPPAYYATTSRLLARPADRQERNLIVFSKLNERYLASLGVRFVITDFPAPHLAERFKLESQNDGKSHYVYELAKPNLGDYSPTRCRTVASAAEALAALQQQDFDFQNDVILFEEMPQPLVEANLQEAAFGRGGMRIRASSAGESLLVLPLPYSACLELIEDSLPDSQPPRLVRVNLSQTGLHFSGSVDATIRYGYGPFDHSFGMLADYFELKKLGLGAVPEHYDRTPPARIENLAVREISGNTARAEIKSVRTYDGVPGRSISAPQEHLIDGNPGTAWISPQQSAQVTEEIVLELADVQAVKRVRWLACDGDEHLSPSSMEIEISRDGDRWTSVADETVQVETRGRWHAATFPAVEAKQLRMRTKTQRHQLGFLVKIAEIIVEYDAEAVPVLELSWTSPQDGGSSSGIYEYDVRWAERPVTTTAQWQAALPLLDFPPPTLHCGEQQKMEVDLQKGEFKGGYLAVVAVDRARNAAPVSNSAPVPASQQQVAPAERVASRPDEAEDAP
jgi:hypothetical protein